MDSKAFDYAQQLTLAAIQAKTIGTGGIPEEGVTIFFEAVYKKLKEIEPKS